MPDQPHFRSLLEAMDQKLDRVLAFMDGPEGEPERGVIVRLDRLEQDAERREWTVRTLMGTIITVGVTALGTAALAVWNFVSHQGPRP